MKRYFLEVAYKGTRYSGFQVQQNTLTVQSEVEKAMETFFRQPLKLTGSSRTDAGVHALQNFFHFDTDMDVAQSSLYNLNAILPGDIVVKSVRQVKETADGLAHARFSAVGRAYRYYIYHAKDPFREDRAFFYPYTLNYEILREVAEVLKEYRDFTSFSKRNTQVKTFLCTLEVSEWLCEDEVLVYHVRGNRFLRGMVRGLVGTMLQAGRGRIDVKGFRNIIERCDCTLADFSVPGRGLFLESVFYPENIFV